IIEEYSPSTSNRVKKKALIVLEEYRLQQETVEDDAYENSTLHFIEATERLLTGYSTKLS
ncbi:MAG: hypothetical protein ACHQIM_16615, partial [Sphingobacteriales bacterium]